VAIAIAAGLLTPACTFGELRPGAEAVPKTGTGIVVVSLERSGSVDAALLLKLRPVGRGFRQMMPLDVIQSARDWSALAREPAGVNQLIYATVEAPVGRLAVLELPAGEYEFYQWQGDTLLWSLISPDYAVYSDPFAVRFTVAPGKVTYAGGLQLELPKYIPPGLMVGQYRLHTVKMDERDLALLRSKYPFIAKQEIAFAPMTTARPVIEGTFRVYTIDRGGSSFN
jgi:hypothetical protein